MLTLAAVKRALPCSTALATGLWLTALGAQAGESGTTTTAPAQ